MGKLIVVMNVYNEAENIANAIESVYDYVDKLLIVDGAYKDFPYDKPWSTDKTLEIASRYPKVEIITTQTPWKDQCIKRSAMFRGEPGDIYLKLDGDEVVTNPEELAKIKEQNFDVAWAWNISTLYPAPYMVARVFRHIDGMHYKGRHHWLYNKDGRFITSDQNMGVRYKHIDTKLRIFNFRNRRSIERRSAKIAFIRNRNVYEMSYAREDKVYENSGVMLPHPNRANSPRQPSIVLREAKKPKYTYTLMVSRRWAVDRCLKSISKLIIPKNTEAVVVIDSKLNEVKRKVVSYFRDDKRFAGFICYLTNNEPLPEFSDVSHRRKRIADNWNIILSESRGEIILGGEDDSLPQPDAYIKLIETLDKQKADFVQGNIIGRWHSPICPAWMVEENQYGEPENVYNLKEKETGVDKIRGVGWYCFAAKASAMRHNAIMVSDLLPLGPDLSFGYRLWKQGYKLLHLWDVKIEHFTERESLILGVTPTVQKVWYKTNGIWNVKTWEKYTRERGMKR